MAAPAARNAAALTVHAAREYVPLGEGAPLGYDAIRGPPPRADPRPVADLSGLAAYALTWPTKPRCAATPPPGQCGRFSRSTAPRGGWEGGGGAGWGACPSDPLPGSPPALAEGGILLPASAPTVSPAQKTH